MRERLVGGITFLVLVFVGGVVGYMLIEGWSFFDSLYMTVITVATVGFAEVAELSDAGRLFTIGLIFAGLAAIGYSFGSFVDFMVEGGLMGILEGRRMEKQVHSLRGHHVVAGIGRVGSEVARSLESRGEHFVIVDEDAEAIKRASEAGWLYVQGDASNEEVLRSAGILRAKSLVTALDTDADNVFVTLTGRTLNPDLFIVARSSQSVSEEKLRKAGADRVITPNIIGGRRMASMVVSPVISDYLDLVSHSGGIEFRLEEVVVEENAPYAGQTIRQARVRDTTGVLILAIHPGDGVVNTNPSSDTVMQPGDHLIVLGTEAQVDDMVKNVCDVK